MIEIDNDTRTFLTRKLLCICPTCKRRIFGADIDIANLDLTKIKKWPLSFIHCHRDKNHPLHALTIYIDANFAIRGRQVTEFVKIQT